MLWGRKKAMMISQWLEESSSPLSFDPSGPEGYSVDAEVPVERQPMATTQPWYVEERADAMARLFLQDVSAELAVPKRDIGVNYLSVFRTEQGTRHVIPVVVLGTEEKISDEYRFPESIQFIDEWKSANVPVLILVANVKQTELFYGWASDITTTTKHNGEENAWVLPVRRIDDKQARTEFVKALSN